MVENAQSPSFSRMLRQLRAKAGLTQEVLAERAQMSARAVSDLERDDQRVPRRVTIDLLADALGLALEDRALLEEAARRGRAQRSSAPEATASSGAPASDAVPEPSLSDPTPVELPEPPPAASPSPALLEPPTAFVGRERDEAAVSHLLRQDDVRLLTLMGPGGVGKTRLALRAAANVRDTFADGSYIVALAPLTDPSLVLSTVARTLGVAEMVDQALVSTLTGAVGTRRLLLVLDNFEHLLAAAPLIGELLAACRGLTVLATSRTALRLQGERLYRVSPLSVPGRTEHLPVDALMRYEAAQLFIARAQDADPTFAITDEVVPTIAEISARLDGLPLAIELAAARVRLLPPQALLARLDSRLKLLTGGARDLPTRQQTLRNAIDWSHSLLEEDEQTLFARLSVFVGGCTIEAIEAVCNADGHLAVDALDGVESLLDKSLLRREEGIGGEPLLGMLETIREYARERLAGRGETDALRRAHALYYLGLAERAEPELIGRQQGAWLARLEQEHDNLRAAIRWAAESGEGRIGLGLAGALWRFWYRRGYLSEGVRRLQEMLVLVTDPEDVVSLGLRAKALLGAGSLLHFQGNFSGARDLYDQSLALYRRLKDQQGMAQLLNNLGVMAQQQEDYAVAVGLHMDSLALRRAIDDEWGISLSLGNLGTIACYQGDYAQATALHEESLAVRRRLGDTQGIAHTLNNLGDVARRQGTTGGPPKG